MSNKQKTSMEENVLKQIEIVFAITKNVRSLLRNTEKRTR